MAENEQNNRKKGSLHRRDEGLGTGPVGNGPRGEKAGSAQQTQTQQQNSSNAIMKWFFPLFSLWICASSNAAFALYWVFINFFQIIQQYIIGKIIDRSDAKKKLVEEAETK